MVIPSKRRYFWRAAFHAPAKVVAAEGEFAVCILDISLKGALLEQAPSWDALRGAKCQLLISLGPNVEICLWCTVMHVDGARVGLRCDHTDLDSVTHLRRLVELNVGDHNILERDLTSLVHDCD